MIKDQFNKVRKLAEEQFRKITQDTEKHRELNKLIDEQFWEEENKETLYPQYFQTPASNRSNWDHLDTKTRAIYVLCLSRAFTRDEIGSLFGISSKTVQRTFKKLA